MHLCWHIVNIYRHELERRNTLTAVNMNYSKKWSAKHIVYFSCPLSEYDDTQSNHIKKVEDKLTPHTIPARGYLCLKCGCCILGPLVANQKEWYSPNVINGQAKKVQTITATPQNIYWQDDTPSDLVFPSWQEYDDFCCTPELHPSSMCSYYDLDANALPGFDDAFQSFTMVADKLIEIFVSESRGNTTQLITVTDIGKSEDTWRLIVYRASQFLRKSMKMTTAEKMAFREVVRVFENCRYGRLRYINVFNGQVSFVSVQGYNIIYKENGEQPSFENRANSDMNIEQLRNNWYHVIHN